MGTTGANILETIPMSGYQVISCTGGVLMTRVEPVGGVGVITPWQLMSLLLSHSLEQQQQKMVKN